MSLILGRDGINRELKDVYIGVGGVNKQEKELYLGKDGVNRQVFQNVLFTLSSIPVDGVTRNFPTTLYAKSIELNISTVLSNNNTYATCGFSTTIGNILIQSERSVDPEEGVYNNTLFQYYDNTGASVFGYSGNATSSGKVKFEIISNTVYIYFNNVLKASKVITQPNFSLVSYVAYKSGNPTVGYTNLVIK